jgi:HEAT repeat protein
MINAPTLLDLIERIERELRNRAAEDIPNERAIGLEAAAGLLRDLLSDAEPRTRKANEA